MFNDESYLYDEPYEVVFGRNTDLWIKRILLYLLLYSLVLGFTSKMQFLFSFTDDDSARYMLSALVQSEAAIVAVVVSLSVVAVQLAASSYSSRVIDLFKNYPDLWIILFIYTYSIFYGLRILKIIIEGDNSQIEYDISTAFQLGMYVFIATILYIYTIILYFPSFSP